jgi:hypothetical protein
MKPHKHNKPINKTEPNVNVRRKISHSTAHRGDKVQICSKKKFGLGKHNEAKLEPKKNAVLHIAPVAGTN